MKWNCGIAWTSRLARAKSAGPRQISWLGGAGVVLPALLLAPAATSGTDSIGPGSLDQPAGGLPHTGDALNRTHWKVQVGDSITGKIVNVTDANLQGANEAAVVSRGAE